MDGWTGWYPGKVRYRAHYGANKKPVYPTGFFPLDDMDCPNVSGEGGSQDGDVGKGDGEGDAVDQGGRLGGEAEVQAGPQQHHLHL